MLNITSSLLLNVLSFHEYLFSTGPTHTLSVAPLPPPPLYLSVGAISMAAIGNRVTETFISDTTSRFHVTNAVYMCMQMHLYIFVELALSSFLCVRLYLISHLLLYLCLFFPTQATIHRKNSEHVTPFLCNSTIQYRLLT